jgi:hypothetical protein
MPRTIVTLLLAVAAVALLSLVFGASYLEPILPGDIPLGDALTAIGLCAAAGSAIGLSARRTALRLVSVVSLVGAVAWLVFSVSIVPTVLCTLTWALVATLLAKYRRAGAA